MADLVPSVVAELQRGLTRAGFYLVSKMRANLNTAQPYRRYTGKSAVYFRGLDPSRPGQFPKKLSGQLVKSVAFSVGELSMTAGTAIPWGRWLQTGTQKMAPRPWLSMTWEREKSAVGRIILGH